MKGWTLAGNIEPQQLQQRLAGSFLIQDQSMTRSQQSLLDSFDWRLYRKGLVLIREGRNNRLQSWHTGKQAKKLEVESKAAQFWSDLPKSALRESVRKILDNRALLPRLTFARTDLALTLGRGSSPARLALVIQSYQIDRQDNVPLQLTLVKYAGVGNAALAAAVLQNLSEIGFSALTDGERSWLLRSAGLNPGDYSSKMDVVLQPEWPVHHALRQILLRLTEVMQQNEEGLRQDIDTEFLHDFRVAIRRSRSALAQIKAWKGKPVRKMRQKLKALARGSNTLRDLDVFLCREDNYRTMLPSRLQPGLDVLFRQMRRTRAAERRQFIKTLDGAEYGTSKKEWLSLLQTEGKLTQSKISEMPILETAGELISAKYRLLQDLAGTMDLKTGDAEWHRLRIECKKFRYLVEFFASLFPAQQISRPLKALKQLQTVLGDYNDLVMQQEDLLAHAEAVKGSQRDRRLAAEAVGGLLVLLHQHQVHKRQRLLQDLAAFLRPEITAAFAALGSHAPPQASSTLQYPLRTN